MHKLQVHWVNVFKIPELFRIIIRISRHESYTCICRGQIFKNAYAPVNTRHDKLKLLQNPHLQMLIEPLKSGSEFSTKG